jgi:hypothetical protein
MDMQTLGTPRYVTRTTTLEANMIDARTFEAALCRGGPVERGVFTERLRIGMSSINLDRMRNDCSIPLLDSLREDSITRSLAKLIDVRIEDGAVIGTIRCHQTEEGRKAATLVTTGKCDIAISYGVEEVEVYDADNRRVDPNDSERANEEGLIFEAVKWQIIALSLVRRDPGAEIGSLDRAYRSPVRPEIKEIFERMAQRHMIATESLARPVMDISVFDIADRSDDTRKIVNATRARMRAAQALLECETLDNSWLKSVMRPDMVFYGSPEKF